MKKNLVFKENPGEVEIQKPSFSNTIPPSHSLDGLVVQSHGKRPWKASNSNCLAASEFASRSYNVTQVVLLTTFSEGAEPLSHTLRIGCTELKAVPHAGLGFQFLRVRKPEKEVEVHQVQRGHLI